MMEAFTLDADAALSASETALLYLERNPRDRTQLRALFRHFHTLKGAAAAVGLTRIAEQLHAGETLLETVIESPIERSPERLIELLLELVDSVAGLLAQVRGMPHEHQILDDVEARVAEVLASVGDESRAAETARHAAGRRERPVAPRDEAAVTPAPPTEIDSAIVRVHASRLDLLMNRVSELVVSRTRMEDSMSAIYELKDKLRLGKLQINETVEGFRGFEFNPARSSRRARTLRGRRRSSTFEFSELEFDKYDDFNVLTRTLVELAADAGEIVEQLGGMIDAIAEESRQVSKVTSSLQRTITGMRLLSIDTLLRRLQRPIRDAARQTGKQIELKCVGGEVQVDRAVIESLYGPLLHLVRNAVSHGIEPVEERRARGKPDTGQIELRAVQRHGSVEVTVRDDGRGLDFAAIRAKAERLGLVEPSETIVARRAREADLPAGLLDAEPRHRSRGPRHRHGRGGGRGRAAARHRERRLAGRARRVVRDPPAARRDDRPGAAAARRHAGLRAVAGTDRVGVQRRARDAARDRRRAAAAHRRGARAGAVAAGAHRQLRDARLAAGRAAATAPTRTRAPPRAPGLDRGRAARRRAPHRAAHRPHRGAARGRGASARQAVRGPPVPQQRDLRRRRPGDLRARRRPPGGPARHRARPRRVRGAAARRWPTPRTRPPRATTRWCCGPTTRSACASSADTSSPPKDGPRAPPSTAATRSRSCARATTACW